MTMQTFHPTLAHVLWRPNGARASRVARACALAFFGALLLTISAKVQIPFTPVPLTMQTLVVLLLGFAYGARLGAFCLLLYLGGGALGLPVFAGTPHQGIGLAYMLGPTGGYLIGFAAAAVFCGMLAERGWDRHPGTVLAAMLAGNLLIYACGLTWLGTLFGWDKPLLQMGMLPFLPGDLVKIAMAMALLPGAWKFVGKRGA